MAWLPALALVLLFDGCAPDYPPIELTGVSPEWGYNGEVTEVEITGRNLYPRVIASGVGEANVDRDFQAWLETDPPTLVDVQLTSFTTLVAQVGEGVTPGVYDLTVAAPDGHSATLPDAFTVTDTRADHLSATTADNSFVAGEPVAVHLELQDPEGLVVPLDLQVDVTVEGTQHGAEGVDFEVTLDDQVALTDGVRGLLRDGKGYVTLTSEESDDLWVTLTPTDPTSVVDPYTIFLSFDAGLVTAIRVDVEGGTDLVAGDAPNVLVGFLDDNDNLAEVAGTVLLYETCPGGTLLETVEISQFVQVPLRVTAATGTATCSENHIAAVSIVNGTEVTGESAALTVAPGPMEALGVVAGPTEVSAGEETATIVIRMEDAYGNWVAEYDTKESDLALTDNVGGLGPTTGWQSCGAFNAGLAVCEALLWESAADVQVTAEDGSGRAGVSNWIAVIPGHAFHLEATPETTTVVAGEPVEVRLQVTDAPGNPISIDPNVADVPTFEDDDGNDVECTYVGAVAGLEEVEAFDCELFEADADEVLLVGLPSRGLVGFETLPFEVINGPLAQVAIDLDGMTSVTAGSPFSADIVGTDAWGNAYVVQASADVDVMDGTDSLTPQVIHLDAAGQALGTTFIVTSATLSDRVYARQAGTFLGSSPPFAVEAGAVDHISIAIEGPVVDVDEPLELEVNAVDAYDNPVPTYMGIVELRSSKDIGEVVTVSEWVDGRSFPSFLFDDVAAQDKLVADDGSYHGESSTYDVVDFACPGSPGAHLDVAGGLPARLCIVGGTTPTTTLDMAASTPGAAPIDMYWYGLGDGTWVRSSDPTYDTAWTEASAYVVEGIAIDEDLCASLDSGIVYAGPFDGEPVGPVELSLSDTTVDAFTGIVTVDLSASDCSGDPAAGGTLLARVDLGELTGGDSAPSGAGVAITLDAVGKASVNWSMVGQPIGGEATFRAGVRTGAAWGSKDVSVTGDSSHPTVFEVEPVGAFGGTFDTIDVLFSDPMLTTSFTTTSVLLEDPSGSLVSPETFVFGDDDRRMTAWFPTQSGSSGTWTLTLTTDVRKAPGALAGANPIDGAFTGASSEFTVDFGSVSDLAPDVLACDPDTTRFRPDGDATGTDPFELDTVHFAVAADGAAEWWVTEVADLTGERLCLFHTAAGGASTADVAWDGRGNDGKVMANGTYLITISAKDSAWNRGAGCQAMVMVDNLLEGANE